MKAPPCTLFATVIAASTVAISSSPSGNSRNTSCISPNEEFGLSDKARTLLVASSVEDKKFSPKFDGLRFIETLVTAHR